MNCIFLCPYFGKLPQNFQLWLDSCSFNSKFEFLVITDDTSSYRYPANVKTKYCSFEDVIEIIQNKFTFKIEINSPYKLCDYKPAYGFVFQDDVAGYDYWGHCDLDLILGDLSKFLRLNTLGKYEKILFLGHMTLYKNTYEVNTRFMTRVEENIDYETIFSNCENYAFDEISKYSINSIYKELRVPVYNKEIYADVSCMKSCFQLSTFDQKENRFIIENRRYVFTYEEGRIFGHYVDNKTIVKNEYAYVHLQKRKFTNVVKTKSNLLIIPNKFLPYENPTVDIIRANTRGNLLYWPYYKNKYKALRFKLNNRIKKKVNVRDD